MKYAFHAIFKGQTPKARIYFANSNNHAHKLRKNIIRNSDILFVSGIQKANELNLPIAAKITNIPDIYKRVFMVKKNAS